MSLNEEAGRVQLQSNLPSVVSFRLLDRFGIYILSVNTSWKFPKYQPQELKGYYIQQDWEIFCRIDPCGTPASSLTNEVMPYFITMCLPIK